ncbi:hypothetical protein C1645_846027 [Glomus cerebriforme]|uniref:Uncharacterized protein n=1 Tax=Glomus cerebriforme TaxID=658196 RepID=A0A397T4M7_9GLOM|nr:hypothetical protein C1645_846027 [Glomus cerebriforme]
MPVERIFLSGTDLVKQKQYSFKDETMQEIMYLKGLFSELFGSDWKGKMVLRTFQSEMERKNVLCTFSLIMESETVLFAFELVREIKNETFSNGSFSFLVDSTSVRALEIRKWFLDFISDIEVSSRNSHLMHLLKESLVEMVCSENSGLEISKNLGLEMFVPGLEKLKRLLLDLGNRNFAPGLEKLKPQVHKIKVLSNPNDTISRYSPYN